MIDGSCHCGAVNWRLSALPEYTTSCNCTLCRRWGVLWAYGFKDEDFVVSGVTHSYLHGPKSIAFHFCTSCGCVAYWCTPQPGADGRVYGAVNLRLAEPASVGSIPVKHFDGLDSFKAQPTTGQCVADILRF